MPPKTSEKKKRARSRSLESHHESSKRIASAESSTSPSKIKCSAEEEGAFDRYIYELVKRDLWKMVKDDPILKGRGANGIRSHWDAKWKKMRG